jgi:hypothetical protein
MPPPESGKTLTRNKSTSCAGGSIKGEVDKHWAYVPPKRSELPTTRNPEWVRNPIDQFARG